MNRIHFLISSFGLALGGLVSLSPSGAEPMNNIGSQLSSEEVESLLRLHNQARTDVGVKPLEWSTKLASYAQNWADKLAKNGEFAHSDGPYGENLAGAGSVEEALNMWLKEKPKYNSNSKKNGFLGCGHYTQMVWKKTRKVGCGKADGPNYTIWICSYDPPGNMRGKSAY